MIMNTILFLGVLTVKNETCGCPFDSNAVYVANKFIRVYADIF